MLSNGVNSLDISFVVIGLNEASNLNESLRAIFNSHLDDLSFEVIYVDSGSTDRSVLIAESFEHVEVVHLDDPKPSAAKARNAGMQLAKGHYIQFVDGDSVLDKHWIIEAYHFLQCHEAYACAFGRLVERNVQRNIYTRLCAFDWYVKSGDYRYCGGNALWRKEDLDFAKGFDTRLKVGEEPDLCYRIRQNHRKIRCLDIPMVEHDLEMNTFKDYWLRGIASGVAYAAVGLRYRHMPEKLWLKEMMRNFFEPVGWLFIFIFFLMFFSLPVAIVVLICVGMLRALRIALVSRDRTITMAYGLAYGLHAQFMRIPLFVGQLHYVLTTLKNK